MIYKLFYSWGLNNDHRRSKISSFTIHVGTKCGESSEYLNHTHTTFLHFFHLIYIKLINKYISSDMLCVFPNIAYN